MPPTERKNYKQVELHSKHSLNPIDMTIRQQLDCPEIEPDSGFESESLDSSEYSLADNCKYLAN